MLKHVATYTLVQCCTYSIYQMGGGAYFGFVEELSEAASGILLRVRGHFQDELHDNSLVSHLLH